MPLPYLTESIPPVDGRFAEALEDFEVEEIPAYEPSGEGEHMFVHIEKRDLTTPYAVEALCRATGARSDMAGWAGLKDRRGITRQWVSLFGASREAIQGAQIEGLRVLSVTPNGQKLRTGHLRGNRFRIRLRGVSASAMRDVERVFEQVDREGLPNYFGEQRFGRSGDNAQRALQWIRDGGRAPRGRFQRKLLVSALQSELFNERVAERVRGKALGTVMPGDLVQKHDSGGMFVADDVAEAQARADRWEISPTGPMFGAKMRWPEGQARDAEEALLASRGLGPEHLAAVQRYGAGTRRLVRVRPSHISLSHSNDQASIEFALPSGSYATVVVREILKQDALPAKTG